MRVLFASASRFLSAVFIAGTLYVVVVGVTVVSAGTRDNGRNADVIVVMGAAQYDGRPSELLESRLAHALDLWRDERAPLIAVTGGKQEGDRFTESEASSRWLVDKGVVEGAILQENVGRSTWESLDELAPVLKKNSVKSVVVVTSNWHAARSALTLEEMGFSVSTSAINSSSPSVGRWMREVAGVAVGRVIGFRNLFTLTG